MIKNTAGVYVRRYVLSVNTKMTNTKRFRLQYKRRLSDRQNGKDIQGYP